MLKNGRDILTKPFRELYFIFTYPIISKLYNPTNIEQPLNVKGTIIIVECWFQKNTYHSFWKSYLERKGYKTILLSFTNMNEEFAVTAKKIDRFISDQKFKNFTLVGISAGAIACLYYLNHFNGWEKTKIFISVAGPLHGAWMAYLIYFTKKGRSLLPSSSFLKELIRMKIPENKMVTMSATVDELVPLNSSVLDGIPSYIIKVYGHNFFHLDHKETYDLIAKLASDSYSSSSKLYC